MHVTRNSDIKKILQPLMVIYKYINEADQLPVLTDNQSDKLKLSVRFIYILVNVHQALRYFFNIAVPGYMRLNNLESR